MSFKNKAQQYLIPKLENIFVVISRFMVSTAVNNNRKYDIGSNTASFRVLCYGNSIYLTRGKIGIISNSTLTSTCSLFTLFKSDMIEFLSANSHIPSASTRDPRI